MELIEEGVMVMKDGKAWGCTYADGRSTGYGWLNPADRRVEIHNPKFCKNPIDITYPGSYLIPELKTASLVRVKRKTIIEIIDEDKE